MSLVHACPFPDWLDNRIEPLSKTNITIAETLRDDKDSTLRLQRIQRFYEETSRTIVSDTLKKNESHHCSQEHINSVAVLLNYYGFGNVERCTRKVQYLQFTHGNHQAKMKRLYDDTSRFADDITIAGKNSIKLSNIKWTGKFYNTLTFKGNSATNNCDLTRSTAYRVNGTWLVAVTLGNHPIDFVAPDRGRWSYNQALFVDDENIVQYHPFKFTLCNGNQSLKQKEAPGFIGRWDKTASWSSFLGLEVSKNPALLGAKLDNQDILDEFRDFDSASDIAIFILPLVLALIPVALFQDVSGFSSLVLFLVADGLSAIPIGLKSHEFMKRTSPIRYVTEAYLYGSMNPKEPGAAEYWMARCPLDGNIGQTGKILLGITIVSMLMAFILDIVFAFLLFRAKRRYLHKCAKFGVRTAPSAGLLWYLRKKNWPRSVIYDEELLQEYMDDT